MIIYFSATGNSKYVANEIAKQTNDYAVSILNLENKITLCLGERLGIVSPTYYWGLPSIVDEFFGKCEIIGAEHPYIYFVATYGTTTGQTGAFVRKHLNRKGLELSASFSVKMPDTWTPIYDLSDKEKVAAINKNEKSQIQEIVNHIRNSELGDYMKEKVPMLAVKCFNPLYENARKTAHFTVDANCVGCGLCESNCPVQAIMVKNGKPIWVKEKCVMCLGCMHHCPRFAIQYGKNTKKHGQYIHP
ncbi:MAG: EFR1 family ferrodoxin [Coprococcus sp.]